MPPAAVSARRAESTAGAFAVAPAVAIAVGLAEWLRAGGGHEPFPAAGHALVAIALAYGGLGLVVGLVAALARDRATTWGATLGLIAAVAVDGADPSARPIVLAAGAALGACVALVTRALARALPALTTPRLWVPAAAALLGVAAGLSARAGTGLPAAAWGACGLALLGAAAGLASRGVPGAWAGLALSLATLALAPDALPRPVRDAPAPAGAPSVLLVSIDTLRADHVGAWGDAGARTPQLDALARRGTRFAEAIAPSVFTGPSHASILSGLHPLHTGFEVNFQGLDRDIPTLAEELRADGYLTAAFPSSWTTASPATHLPERFHYADEELREHPWLPTRAFRAVLLRPLDRLLKARESWPPYRPAGPTTDRAVRWLQERGEAPFFVWVHYFDPHLPYEPPPELVAPAPAGAEDVDGSWYRLTPEQRAAYPGSPARLQRMRQLYDAEIAYVDRELGRLLEAARIAAGGQLWVVVVADHGEPMGEHGLYWVRDLYDATLHVPLVIAPPEPPAVAEVQVPVRLLDIAPTLLQVAGVEPPRPLDGVSLLPLMRGESAAGPGPVTSLFAPEPGSHRRRAASLRTATHKLIERAAGWSGLDTWAPPSRELYDLAHDPGELDDRSRREPGLARALGQQLEPWQGAGKARRALSESEREQLRALGYVQ